MINVENTFNSNKKLRMGLMDCWQDVHTVIPSGKLKTFGHSALLRTEKTVQAAKTSNMYLLKIEVLYWGWVI